jgi:hypothetical protein
MNTNPTFPETTTFIPGLFAVDEQADYWLRQVTLRMRREIGWLRYARGGGLEPLPPLSDRVQEALDLVRFQQERAQFFADDTTAVYLTQQIDTPLARSNVPPLRGSFGWVVDQLDLDAPACFLLALALVSSIDGAVGHVIAACLNDHTKTQPTLTLAQRLWDDPTQILFLADPNHPLFKFGLIRQGAEPAQYLDWNQPLRSATSIALQLLSLEESSLPSAAPMTSAEGGKLQTQAHIVARSLAAGPPQALRVVPIIGSKGSGHIDVALRMADVTGRPLTAYSPGKGDDRNTLATLCWLTGRDLFLSEDIVSTFLEVSGRSPGMLLPALNVPINLYLAVSQRSQIPPLPGRHLLPLVTVPEFGYFDRLDTWRRVLASSSETLSPSLIETARRFRFGRETIERVGRRLNGLQSIPTDQQLVSACRSEVSLDISDLAQEVSPRFENERLILPPKQAQQFNEVIRAMRSLTKVHYTWGTAKVWNEGGISVLFAGPPGTGKTMGAEILAIELDLPIYRIDLSQVVNKYIGETEKNLKRLFDAADVSDIILFFDEADAIFGQRTEVKDAHDRYANLEISYLLDRMERFKGLAILATNRKKDLDEAFMRRLRYIIDFPLPDEEERRLIWEQVIPVNVDASELDFDFLARQFRLAGGHIRSIVFNACLQSADSSEDDDRHARLNMDHVIIAVKREYDKLKRAISLEQFGLYAATVEKLERENGTN